jgi:hypothetical protein
MAAKAARCGKVGGKNGKGGNPKPRPQPLPCQGRAAGPEAERDDEQSPIIDHFAVVKVLVSRGYENTSSYY